MRFLRCVLPICLVLAAAGCADSPREGLAPGERLRITTTTGIIADTTAAIAGEHAEVIGLMGPGVDPHLYKATHGDLEKLNSAHLILYNGLFLEGKMADILVRMARRVETVQVTAGIPEELLREPPEFDGQYDPHVWFDVALWRHVAEHIRDTLVRVDPENAEEYRRNAETYLAALDELDNYVREQIATIPPESRILVTAHDAFGYFGEAYDIEVMGIQGISTLAEYGLQDLDRLIDEIVARRVKAVFMESSVSPRSIEALVAGVRGRGHEVSLGGTLYSDALGEAGTATGTYLGMVRHNVDTIVEALR